MVRIKGRLGNIFFYRHTLLCVLVLFAIIAMVFISWQIIPQEDGYYLNWTFATYFFAFFAHFLFIVYFYSSPKKYSLFALPLSHIIVPIGLIIIAVIIEQVYGVGGWLFAYAFFFSILYLLPVTIITFVISSIICATRKRKKRSESIVSKE